MWSPVKILKNPYGDFLEQIYFINVNKKQSKKKTQENKTPKDA